MADTLPNSMHAIDLAEYGDEGKMQLVDLPLPEYGPEDVLIKVYGAGVNRPDVLQRQGAYPPPPGASTILGLEVAGEVVATGAQVTHWQVGDRVCALVTGGGYAQYCAAPAVQCLPIPQGLNHLQAAALPETFFTVWSNVFDRAGLTNGERFLVHGGASGIGTTAIQLASAFGASVYATAGSDEKCRLCEQLGAQRGINYKQEDYVSVVKQATNDVGVDVILDMVGGDYIERNLAACAPDGRIVNIAFLQGSKVTLDMRRVMLKRLTLTGSTLRARDVNFKAAIANNLLEQVWPLIEDGKIAPVIDSVHPLENAADAHRRIDDAAHMGKIVLEVSHG